MGLKSGSQGTGLDEDAEEEADGMEEPPADAEESADEESPGAADGDLTESEAQSATQTESAPDTRVTSTASSSRPTMDSIPYKLRRSRVNEGREQVPFFLRDEVLDGETELQESLETMLGEDVYESDCREAAMIVAQRNPELVAEVPRDWGYDLE